MKKVLILICFCLIYNVATAQSLGKMTLGCKRTEIPLSLPKGFHKCTKSTNTQLTYSTENGDEYVSFNLNNSIVDKIEMHKFVGLSSDVNEIKSKLEELLFNLYEMWGEPSYVGENIYWQFQGSKATFSYTVSSYQVQLPSSTFIWDNSTYLATNYKCYADIKLEKKSSNLFE